MKTETLLISQERTPGAGNGRRSRMFKSILRQSLTIALGLMVLSSCKKDDDNKIRPEGPKPEWGPTIKPEMQTVIEKLMSYGTPPLPTLSVADARKAPSATTAVMDVMKDYNIPMPVSNADTTGRNIPVVGGSIHLRIYTPKTGAGPFPVIVYYHGGGWAIANLDTYDASARALSDQVGAVVVSVAYRQSPEFKFPIPVNDSYAAYQWVVANAATIKGDPAKIAVAGESAGGNLATAVSIKARDNGIKMPVHQLLVYPVANYDFNSASYNQYAAAKPLDKPLMQWFFGHYLPNPADGSSPLVSIVNANLAGLPPATIISAEIDPLQSEGVLLAERLKTAGVAVMQKTFIGVPQILAATFRIQQKRNCR